MLCNLGLLVLRLAIGVLFLAHGSQKVFGAFGGPGIEAFTGMIKSMGFPAPVLMAWLAALSEFAGGLLLLLGILPRLSAASIAVVMLVAIVKVHWSKGLIGQGGFEYPFLILMVCIALIIEGSGKFSVFNKF